jgi:hypothetical protein
MGNFIDKKIVENSFEDNILLDKLILDMNKLNININNLFFISENFDKLYQKKIIYINLKNNDDEYLDYNYLIYKMIHLCILSNDYKYNHSNKFFWKKFKYNLDKAIDLKILDKNKLLENYSYLYI